MCNFWNPFNHQLSCPNRAFLIITLYLRNVSQTLGPVILALFCTNDCHAELEFACKFCFLVECCSRQMYFHWDRFKQTEKCQLYMRVTTIWPVEYVKAGHYNDELVRIVGLTISTVYIFHGEVYNTLLKKKRNLCDQDPLVNCLNFILLANWNRQIL